MCIVLLLLLLVLLLLLSLLLLLLLSVVTVTTIAIVLSNETSNAITGNTSVVLQLSLVYFSNFFSFIFFTTIH